MRGFIIPTLEFRGRDIAARPAELNPAFLCPIICPAKLFGHQSDLRPPGHTKVRLKTVKLGDATGCDKMWRQTGCIDTGCIDA
ncbi:hypothetical protein [Mesorhizobium sp.]|uniref:hypothetical protein n=1 Tax=Mesorhizobium sp. TaxID=1871066 RepID=UPI000FEA9434|nr:hypothetical protein [Mesorhizobium sp.]RWK42403.1 MAG: hypothetical protein EOR46_11225 [Mesorhizobium sp.]RWK69445.1 MAG: hypothetical protein EOR54_08815 [Mesorhizobium sp.]RWK79621.1 MAG: hypothetical protein EOR50_05690 [Mesorhizobium sp.]RWK82396.1 MAG: hypothetical protein EOR51_11960 [Mesorhizobium sp.]RWL08785.1 MAG: hypothetical protein EOR55_03590 [Mesorhizobium sp.]